MLSLDSNGIVYERMSVMMKKKPVFLALAMGVVLSGCTLSHQSRQGDAEVKKADVEGINPPVSYEAQLDLILKEKDTWCFSLLKDATEPEEMFVTESDYYYRISDMDQNGRLEIVSSTTNGNGSIFNNAYYEVSEDGKELVKLPAAMSDSGEVLEPDLWDFSGYSSVYYDKKTKTYHYPQWDHTHSSAVDTEDIQEDMALLDGVVMVNAICGQKSKADDPKQAEGYGKKLVELAQKYYEGMEEFTVTFRWFQNINTKKYMNSNKIKVLSDEKLREKMENSWDSFGIHDMGEDGAESVNNPYFPADFTKDTEVDFAIDLFTYGKATMKSQIEQVGKKGVLYKVSWHDPREWISTEFSRVSKSTKESVKENLEECSFYLWVTDTQIYYIPLFYTYDSVDEEDYRIMRLLFYDEIPEYALLVCQEEEMEDSLEEMEEGEHQWIEKHTGDIRCYRSYTSRGEGYDTANIFQFVWKKGVGLIGLRSMAHPAGGFSTFLWRESYLQKGDVAFSIDE